jgi:hypothetical protein
VVPFIGKRNNIINTAELLYGKINVLLIIKFLAREPLVQAEVQMTRFDEQNAIIHLECPILCFELDVTPPSRYNHFTTIIQIQAVCPGLGYID